MLEIFGPENVLPVFMEQQIARIADVLKDRSGDPYKGKILFTKSCAKCHFLYGQGGRIGPDLNVPQSIVEYRPADQIKAFVRNPRTFRYTSMPAHLHLSNEDLDALVAYFEAMKDRKRDPGNN